MLGSIKWDFRATAKIRSVDASTETLQSKAVLTGMGQLPSIFQVHVGFFSPGLRKYRKLMEWKQIFQVPSMFARSTSGGFSPTHLEPILS